MALPKRDPKTGRFLAGEFSGVLGINKVREALKARLVKAMAQRGMAAVVGFTAEYAVYVHENLEANHPRGGQAKFLEQPAREEHREIAKTIIAAVKRKLPLEMCLYQGGLRLQAMAQKLVPVLTGNLKGSAFTRIEGAKAFNPMGVSPNPRLARIE